MSLVEKKVEVKELKTLLTKTKRVLTHHREMTKARGEHYNLFSVFGIETRENKTHSAFLADLLNPKGAHQMGDVFLQLFNTVVGHTKMVDNNKKIEAAEKSENNQGTEPIKVEESLEKQITAIKPFVWNSQTKVVVEKVIGKISKSKTSEDEEIGGRIDIFLTDKQNNIISIENKIHAGDRKNQVERYCNYKPTKNTVYYLTLTGGEPSKISKEKKELYQDYYNISYKEHIQDWLTLCLREVTNFVSLRETINQYILLIKKLTYTLNATEKKELEITILSQVEEARFIHENYESAVQNTRDRFRHKLKKEIEDALDLELFSVTIGDPIKSYFAQIWIALKEQQGFRIGVESFSGKGHQGGKLFVGVFDKNYAAETKGGDKDDFNKFWPKFEYLTSSYGNNINLSHNFWLQVIADEKTDKYKKEFKQCKTQILAFIEQYEPLLIKDKK
jgi:hypothetical protein